MTEINAKSSRTYFVGKFISRLITTEAPSVCVGLLGVGKDVCYPYSSFFQMFFSKNIEADINCRKCHEYGKNILGLRF